VVKGVSILLQLSAHSCAASITGSRVSPVLVMPAYTTDQPARFRLQWRALTEYPQAVTALAWGNTIYAQEPHGARGGGRVMELEAGASRGLEAKLAAAFTSTITQRGRLGLQCVAGYAPLYRIPH